MQPPASLKALASPVYEAFYGFTEQPFAISTDPKFLFLSASHQQAFDELRAGLERRESLTLLTGETGTGKTTLVRGVIASLGDRTFSSIQHHPYMLGAEMLRLVLRDFGMVSREDLRRGVLAEADVPRLIDTLEGFLRSLVSLDSQAIVVLDEAQSLSPKLLDEVRMLTALEHDGQRLIQIVLCGQPLLSRTLNTEPLYAMNERITRRVALMPLTPAEVEAYVTHRLAIAAGETTTVAFSAEATALIADLSRGLPRRVNLLCDRALQEGRIEGMTLIGPDLVKRAGKSIAGQHEPRKPVPLDRPFASVVEDSERNDRLAPEPVQTPGAAPAPIEHSRPGTAAGDAIKQAASPVARAPGGASRRWSRRAQLAAAGVLVAVAGVAGSYGVYAQMLVRQPMALPPTPVAPARALPPMADPIQPLTEEEMRALIVSVM